MNIVKQLRKKKGIQQKELAMDIGVTQPTVSDWESGKKDPSGDRLKKLAEYFDVDELIILGKGIIDLTDEQEHDRFPITDEAKEISGGVDLMPKEQRQKILTVFKIMYPNIFGGDQNK